MPATPARVFQEGNDSPSHPPSLAESLEALLADDRPNGFSIGELVESVGEKGFGLLLLVLSLPSALPVPAPGYSTPFGLVIILIAAQMLAGREALWLPRRLREVRLKPTLAKRMLGTGARFLRKVEHLIRPRQRWVTSRTGQTALGALIIAMAALMVLPIPLTNTAPAMVIFLLGAALTEDDGLLAAAAFAAGCLAVLLYAGVIYLLITEGPEAIDAIKGWIKARVGAGG